MKSRSCDKVGHIAKVCRSKGKEKQGSSYQQSSKDSVTSHHRTNKIDTSAHTIHSNHSDIHAYTMFNISSRSAPITISLTLNGCPATMELDTGASYSIMGEMTFRSILGDSVSIDACSDITLRTYMGEILPLLGKVTVSVAYHSQVVVLPLLIVQGEGAALFRRNWLEQIQLDWSSIHSVKISSGLHDLLQKHQQLFWDELGTLQGTEAVIHVPPHSQPRFFKARPIPYAMKEKVEKELLRLQEANVISPVEFSDWAAPIVPVVKSDGSLRICGDYSVTVNAVSKLDSYPLPRVDDLFTAMCCF